MRTFGPGRRSLHVCVKYTGALILVVAAFHAAEYDGPAPGARVSLTPTLTLTLALRTARVGTAAGGAHRLTKRGMRCTTDARQGRLCRCDCGVGTVLGGMGSTSNFTTGTGTGAGPWLAVGPGQLGQHSSYANLTGSSFQAKHDMSPAQRREKAGSGGSTLEGEKRGLMQPSVAGSSHAPSPRYGSVGHIVDNSLPTQLQYIDLTYTVEDSSGAVQGEAKQILSGMTFEIQRGTMFAIMGPSGAGKTTLLGILGMRTMRGDLEYTRFTKVSVCVPRKMSLAVRLRHAHTPKLSSNPARREHRFIRMLIGNSSCT